MIRAVLVLCCIAVALAGLVFGYLNRQAVAIDLYLAEIQWPLGAALIASLLLGIVLGAAAVYAGSVWRLKAALRRARRQGATPPAARPALEAQGGSGDRPGPHA